MTQFEPKSDEIGQYSKKQIRLENDYTDDELLIELRRRGRLARVDAEVTIPAHYSEEDWPMAWRIESAWRNGALAAAKLHRQGVRPSGLGEWTAPGRFHPMQMRYLEFPLEYIVDKRRVDTTP